MDNFIDDKSFSPLADRMRPKTIEEFIGQEHIISENKPLFKAIKNKRVNSLIFYGPPGTGKTTLAQIIASTCDGIFKKLNAISSGKDDAVKIINEARTNLRLYGKQTYLLLDECHRWNKAQSDSLLEALEDGSIILIGSTTENPFTSMTRAIVSRCFVYEFKPLSLQNVVEALSRALINKEKGYGNLNVKISGENLKLIAQFSGGDIRKALNILEFCVNTNFDENEIIISEEDIKNVAQNFKLSLNDDLYFDMLSAFCKSVRGSDADAALFYANKLIDSGIDPLIIARRLIAHASEDIGLADSNALLLAVSAHYAIKNLGLPEGNIPLTHAIIYACEASKSNSVIKALESAKEDVLKTKTITIPNNLKNHPSTNSDGTGEYKYPHNYGGYVYQQYLPNELKDRNYYVPSNNGKEKNLVRKKVKK
ncbi:MAG: replication-associated recombination protein A [Christensenellales bacterium]